MSEPTDVKVENANLAPDTKPDDTKPDVPDTPKLYDITVNGETRRVTEEEMKKLAEKAGGADATFREASAARAQATTGLQVQALMARIGKGEANAQEVRQLAGMLGISDEEYQEAYDAVTGGTVSDDSVPFTDEPRQIATSDLPKEVQEELAASRELRVENLKGKMEATIKQAVDNDPILGKLTVEGGDSKRGARVVVKMQDEVQRRVLLGEQFGPEMLAAAAQKVRAELEDFGVTAESEQQVNVTLPPGDSALQRALQAGKPKPVAVTDPGYSDNVYLRLAAAAMGRE